MNAIETSGLTRRYGDVTAVDQLDMVVGRGEIYGFLGLNGAGKTTTIRMLLGMTRPSAGSASVLGVSVRLGRGPWDRIGYLVESPAPYPSLSVRENMCAVARLRGAGDADVGDTIERLGLAPYASRRAGTLSQGNRQRLGLATAMFHRPELLILDEPANGLDPAGVVEVRELLRSLASQQGTTVLMSSHILAEVDRLATRIGIIHGGRLIEELDIDDLDAKRERRLVVETRDLAGAERALTAAGYRPEANGDRLLLAEPAAVARPDDVATTLVRAGHPPTELAVTQQDLEAHFLELTTEDGAPR